jgi:hypothetical protein
MIRQVRSAGTSPALFFWLFSRLRRDDRGAVRSARRVMREALFPHFDSEVS